MKATPDLEKKITKGQYRFPIPEIEPNEELDFQRKSEEVTFEVFNILKTEKK